MARFVAGAVLALMLVAGGLFWWQGRAGQELAARPSPEAASAPVDMTLPEGDEDAIGAPPPMPPEARPEDREAKRFNRYDGNRDGAITRIEMMGTRTDEFRKLDTDRNNLLSFEEWAVKTSDRFAGADGNRDGKLNRAEFATTAQKAPAKPKCRC